VGLELIETEVKRFLESETPEVLVVRGKWGVGKTFGWNELLEKHQKSISKLVDKYTYVSLFGVGSLEQLKRALFENSLDTKVVGQKPSIESFRTNSKELTKSFGRKWLKLAANTSFGKILSPTIDALSFISIKNTIICLDDLERRTESLSIKEVLGLVSLLKEDRSCRIVLLLNDDAEDMEDYKKYKEKVIDIELLYEPSSQESSQIAFAIQNSLSRHMAVYAQSLKITNIRTLKKADRVALLLEPHLGVLHPDLKKSIAHSLVLFTHCYFNGGDKKTPALEYVVADHHTKYYGKQDEGPSPEQQTWNAFLEAYEYTDTDDLDRVLARCVETGVLNTIEFTPTAAAANEQVLLQQARASFSTAWNLYHHSFENNQEDVLNGLYDSFRENASHITAPNLDGTVRLFRELSDNERADNLIDYWIAAQEGNGEVFNLSEYAFSEDIRDHVVRERLQDAYDASENSESAQQIIARIAETDGWNQADEEILASADVSEFVQAFKSDHGRRLSSVVTTCLQFGRFQNSTERQLVIGQKAEEALRQLADESEINRRRVAKFGITLPDQ